MSEAENDGFLQKASLYCVDGNAEARNKLFFENLEDDLMNNATGNLLSRFVATLRPPLVEHLRRNGFEVEKLSFFGRESEDASR